PSESSPCCLVEQQHTSHNKGLPAPRPLRVRSDLHGPRLLWRGNGVARILREPVCGRSGGGPRRQHLNVMWSSADRLWSQLAAARKRRFPRAARGEEVILGRNAPHLRSEFCLSGALIPSCLLGLRLGPSSPRSRRRKAACSRASPLASNTGRIERLRSQLASAVKWRRLSRS